MPSKPGINLIERIIASSSYFTLGLTGFVWLIIAALQKKRVTDFILYHFIQAIFITMAYYLVVLIFNFPLFRYLYMLLYKIPLINLIPYYINMPLSLFLGLSVLQLVKIVIVLYLSITSFMGNYTYVPYVSDIARGKSGR
jgi:hypothetical protein